MFWYGIKILCGVNDIQVEGMTSMKDLVIQNKLSQFISIISICESKLFRNQVFVFREAKFSSLITNVNNEVHKRNAMPFTGATYTFEFLSICWD